MCIAIEEIEINLKDFIWETEEHPFVPKENVHAAVKAGKKIEAQKKALQTEKRKMEPKTINVKLKKEKSQADMKDHLDEFHSDDAE